jgi:hypothetical protein
MAEVFPNYRGTKAGYFFVWLPFYKCSTSYRQEFVTFVECS